MYRGKSQAQRVIENAIVFGLPDSIAECEHCDLAVITRAVMAAIFARSIIPAVRDYADEVEAIQAKQEKGE